MPANHCVPHTEEAKAKMSAARKGMPATWKHRPSVTVDGVLRFRCGSCGGFFSREGFYSNKRTILGLTNQCRTCHGRTSVGSRNRVLYLAAKRLHEAKRRAWKAGVGGELLSTDVARLTEILGAACLKCGSGKNPTLDHVVPLSRGGANHPLNIQPLCRACNERKQATTADYRTAGQLEIISALWPAALQSSGAVSFKVVQP